MNTKSETFTISQLAEQLEISTHTIRFYEEKGLISPDRTSGNQRIYTRKDRARLKLILRGKRFGFSLREIAEMIGMADSEITEEEQILKSLSFATGKLDEIAQRRDELDFLEKDILALKSHLLSRLTQIRRTMED